MSTLYETCNKCNTKLIIDDGDCYAGGLRDNEIVFCPKCNNQITVYTSGKPHVYFESTSNK